MLWHSVKSDAKSYIGLHTLGYYIQPNSDLRSNSDLRPRLLALFYLAVRRRYTIASEKETQILRRSFQNVLVYTDNFFTNKMDSPSIAQGFESHSENWLQWITNILFTKIWEFVIVVKSQSKTGRDILRYRWRYDSNRQWSCSL